MQIYRTLKVALCLFFLLACLPALGLRPALAQEVGRPDTSQTKTDASQPPPTATDTPTAQPPPALELTPLVDDQGMLAVAVPTAWSDVAQGEWLLGGAPAGRKLSASPNQADFAANWGTPGITVYFSTSLPAAMEPEDVLAVFDFAGSCDDAGRGALPPAQRTVTYQIWQNCAEAGTAVVVLLVEPSAERTYYGVVEVYLAGVDDLRALAPILASVQFGPAGPTAGPAATPLPAAESTLPPPTPTPTPTSTPAPVAVPVAATVTTDRLNLRSGPSTEIARLTVVTRGMQLIVTGQIDDCAWLRVTAPDGVQGWVSGDPQFTSLDAACTAIPVVETP
jgi:hypothetical protein